MAWTSLSELHRVTVRGGPSRPVLVLVHGYGCDQTMWRHLVPHLEPEYRVVTYDQAGAGPRGRETYDAERHATLQGYADDLLAICRELELEDVVVVGHSIAAMIGVLAHVTDPELVAGLVMISPSPRFIDAPSYVGGFTREQIDEVLASIAHDFEDWARTMAPAFMGHPERPELAAELAASLLRTDPAIAEEFARVTFLSDNRAQLPAIQCPTLVVQATGDPFAPQSVGEYVHGQVDRSALTTIETTGHFAHVSEPEKTAGAILTFLRPIRSFLRRTRT